MPQFQAQLVGISPFRARRRARPYHLGLPVRVDVEDGRAEQVPKIIDHDFLLFRVGKVKSPHKHAVDHREIFAFAGRTSGGSAWGRAAAPAPFAPVCADDLAAGSGREFGDPDVFLRQARVEIIEDRSQAPRSLTAPSSGVAAASSAAFPCATARCGPRERAFDQPRLCRPASTPVSTCATRRK